MLRFIVAFMFAGLMLGPAAAHQYSKGALNIVHPSSRPAAKGMNGVGYLTVNNTGSKPDVLLAVECPLATKVEIHASSNTGGVSRMRKVQGGVPAPARGVAKLAPGGTHIMLIKLKRPLAVGDKVPATLVFKNAGRVPIEMMVTKGAAKESHKH
ncbi:MAG TPA: copper chaperone PCu(A)C [Caulobacteraceae bacterium]